MKAVITRDLRLAGWRAHAQSRVPAFCHHWSFTPRACRPYRAQTKGKVERPGPLSAGQFRLRTDVRERRRSRSASALADASLTCASMGRRASGRATDSIGTSVCCCNRSRPVPMRPLVLVERAASHHARRGNPTVGGGRETPRWPFPPLTGGAGMKTAPFVPARPPASDASQTCASRAVPRRPRIQSSTASIAPR